MIESRGGYQIVDLLKYSTIDNFVIPGIYECAKNGQNKPIVLYNLVHNGVVMPPIYPQSVIINSESVIIEYSYFDINKIIIATINIDDNVVITERDIGSGGGTTCYKISYANGLGYSDGSFNLNVTVPFDFEVIGSTGYALLVEKNNSVTLNVVWGEDVNAEFHYNDDLVSNTFIYAKEYTITNYIGDDEEDSISKFITIEEVTL